MKKTLIAYDGNCGLCHGWVKFVLRYDKQEKFNFTPLQSEYFKIIAKQSKKTIPDSVVVFEEEQIWFKTSAIIFILRNLGFGWKLLGNLIWIIPRFIRNWGYDLVASLRKKLWKQPRQACPIVPQELRDRFTQ